MFGFSAALKCIHIIVTELNGVALHMFGTGSVEFSHCNVNRPLDLATFGHFGIVLNCSHILLSVIRLGESVL